MGNTATHKYENVKNYVICFMLYSEQIRSSDSCVIYKNKTHEFFFPKFNLNQPCFGELAYYTDVHGDKEGWPNKYRPSDLFNPALPRSDWTPWSIFVRYDSTYLPFFSKYLKQNEQSPFFRGTKGMKIAAKTSKYVVVEYDTECDINVLVAFLWCCRSAKPYVRSKTLLDMKELLEKLASDNYFLSNGSFERFRNCDPHQFMPGTYRDGQNYCRGNIRGIFKDGKTPTVENLNTCG